MTGDLGMYGQDELLNRTVLPPLVNDYNEAFPELSKFTFKNASFKMEMKRTGTDHVRYRSVYMSFSCQ